MVYPPTSCLYLPTYIIGTDGVIKYAFVDVDYRKRAEPAEILDVLKVYNDVEFKQ